MSLLVPSRDRHRRKQYVRPAFKGDDLEENEESAAKRVERPHMRVLPGSRSQIFPLDSAHHVLAHALCLCEHRSVVTGEEKTSEQVLAPNGERDDVEDGEDGSIEYFAGANNHNTMKRVAHCTGEINQA